MSESRRWWRMSSAPKDGSQVELRLRSIGGEIRIGKARWVGVETHSRMTIFAWRLDDDSMVGMVEATGWRRPLICNAAKRSA